jgi:hypothetical protein
MELPGWMQYPITNDMMASPEPGGNVNSENGDNPTDSNADLDPADDSDEDHVIDIPAMLTTSGSTSDEPVATFANTPDATFMPHATHPRPPKQWSITGPVVFGSTPTAITAPPVPPGNPHGSRTLTILGEPETTV